MPEENAQNNKERFLSLCKSIERKGIDELMSWLEKSDFYASPASTRFHGAKPGGLLEHSLNVYDELVRILEAYPEIHADRDSVVIVSLFHDLCKVNSYATEKRNRKNEFGQWESYDAYKTEEKVCYGGHGSKSVFILQNFMKLTLDEAVAVNAHMGSWDGNKDVGKVYEQFPFAWALHMADEAATFIKESNKSERSTS